MPLTELRLYLIPLFSLAPLNAHFMNPTRRILLLPGYGEDERIFRHLEATLAPSYRYVIVDYKRVLPHFTPANIKLERFIKRLIFTYGITERDILIGHSLGGYLAHHIRQATGCEACLHSSFIHPAKIKILLRSQAIIKQTVGRGILNTTLAKAITQWRYQNQPSAYEIDQVMQLLDEYGAQDVLKLTLLFFRRRKRTLGWLRSRPAYVLPPSLIIHPTADRVVAPPDLPHHSVPGDHFSIVIHPEPSIALIRDWLNGLAPSPGQSARAVALPRLPENAMPPSR